MANLWEKAISIDTDSGPLGYGLSYCGSRSEDFFTFIQIGFLVTLGHIMKAASLGFHWRNVTSAVAIVQSRFGLSHLMRNFLYQSVTLGTKDTGRFAQICFTVKWYVCLFELGFYYSKYIQAVCISGLMH